MEKLPQERIDKFKKVLKGAKEKIAIILNHDDPDAFACAKVFEAICKLFEKSVKIFSPKILDTPQNKYIWNKFSLVDDFHPLDTFADSEDKNEYDTILLDSSSLEDARLGGLKIDPVIIIDHHPNETKLDEPEDKWYWVSAYGAAISMVARVFLDVGLEFKLNDSLATLAVIGLLTDADTKLLSPHMTELDYDIFHHLSKFMNAAKAKETFDAVYDMKYVTMFVTAIQNMSRDENLVITHFEYMPREDIGYLAILADDISNIKEVDVVFIYVIAEDSLYVKVRADDSVELDSTIKKIFKNPVTGKTYGGARHGKGAAQVPLGFWVPTEDNKAEFMEWLHKKMKAVINL
ncbi:bifunctional oligoribonuclease/PAP phosphatase NrnA [Patescibacteria group bacterium]